MANRYPSVPPKTLAVDLSASSTTLKLTDINDWAGNPLTTADFPTDYTPATLINDSGTILEFVLLDSSTIPNGTTTGITIYRRGLKFFATGDISANQTEIPDNKLPWTQGQTKVLMGTHPPYLWGTFANKQNTESITGVWTYDVNSPPRMSSQPAYGSGSELYLITKEYADNLVISGAPNASTTQKGIVQIATTTQAADGTATGSTGAVLVPTTEMTNDTSSAAVLIPVTEADGDLNIGFMPLDQAWSFTSTVNISNPANWSLNSIAFNSTMSFLNLTTGGDASNADNAHIHNPSSSYGTFFETAGRFTASTTGTATNTLGANGWVGETTAISSAACEIMFPDNIQGLFDRDYVASFLIKATAAPGANIRGSAFFAVADNSAFGTNVAEGSIVRSARNTTFELRWENNTTLKLYAVSGDGSNSTETDISSTVTETNDLNCTIRKNGATVQYFVNGTLLATHTSNTPSGGEGELLRVSINSTGAGSGTMNARCSAASIQLF